MENKADPPSVAMEAFAPVDKANTEHKFMTTNPDEVIKVL